MGNFQQWIQIDEVIAAYLDRSEQGAHKQFKAWHIAFDGMKELGIDFFYTVQSRKLPVNANFTVNLPDDYLNYSKVGVFNASGEVIPLIYNDKLTFWADQQADRSTQTQDFTLIDQFRFNNLIFFNFWDGQIFENLYGIPSGAPFVGNFKIDNNAGIILLDQFFQYPYVVLEYIASPKPKQGTYFLPFQFKEALIAYIGWKDIQLMPNTRKGTGADKQQRRRDYYNERRLARARYHAFQIEQAYEENLRNQRLAVKA